MLEITNLLGRINAHNSNSSNRGKMYREQLEMKEFEFAVNLWNIINKYLFNYVDSIILIDFLTIMLSKDPLYNVELAEKYIDDVSTIEGLPQEQLNKNRSMNDNIYMRKPWSIEKLFREYIEQFKQPIQLTRQIKGPIRQVKQFETLTDHFKDCTFKPKISSMSIEIEKKKRMEIK